MDTRLRPPPLPTPRACTKIRPTVSPRGRHRPSAKHLRYAEFVFSLLFKEVLNPLLFSNFCFIFFNHLTQKRNCFVTTLLFLMLRVYIQKNFSVYGFACFLFVMLFCTFLLKNFLASENRCVFRGLMCLSNQTVF